MANYYLNFSWKSGMKLRKIKNRKACFNKNLIVKPLFCSKMGISCNEIKAIGLIKGQAIRK